MKKTPIEHLPVVKHYAEYFLRKAKRALKLKKADYKSFSVEYTSRGMIHVWFFSENGIVGHIIYKADGKKT